MYDRGPQDGNLCETSTRQLAQKLLLIHVIFEGLAAVDEDHGNFVIELPPKFGFGVDVDFVPGEATPSREFDKTFLDHFAQVAALPGIDHNRANARHGQTF